MTIRPRILFVVMSAVHRAAAIDQLARSLAPHTVLVHHDFGQTPDFRLNEPNVAFVQNPKRTGWAVWGFMDGIVHSLRHGLEHHEFDYLQLLSPTCLPIKPMAAFERHVAEDPGEAHFGAIDLLADRDALMAVGYRAFSPEHSLRHRVLRRLSLMYFGSSQDRRDVAGVQVRTGVAMGRNGRPTAVARIALWTAQASSHPLIGRHIFGSDLRPHFGSTWFGARRHVVAGLVDRFDQPDIQRYGPTMRIGDEFLVPTLLKHTNARQGPSNHFINTFVDANPDWFAEQDLPRLQRARQFFARKFVDDPSAAVRRRVLRELVGIPESALID